MTNESQTAIRRSQLAIRPTIIGLACLILINLFLGSNAVWLALGLYACFVAGYWTGYKRRELDERVETDLVDSSTIGAECNTCCACDDTDGGLFTCDYTTGYC